MITLTKSRKLELIEECKKVMRQSSPDGDIHPIYQIALASLESECVAFTSVDALADVYCGNTSMMGPKDTVGFEPLYIAPPVPEIKLPDKLAPCDMLPISGEDAWNNCIDEIKRLNGWE